MNKVLKGSFLTCLCLGLLACQSRHALVDQPLNSYPEYITSGDILPIASITTIDGVDIDLHRTDKKKLVVLFATWCSDSNRLLTALNNSALLTDKSLQVIAIAREDDEKVVKAWRNKHNIKVAIALDEDRSIYKRFAGGGIPRIITVNEDNQIIKMNLAEGQAPLSKVIWH
ncbi:TlpA family protein disulfide reductase [Colwelliaceae bacterium MEBiC 14330]